MKRTVFAKFEVEDNVNNGFVVNTLEKQALEMAHCDLEEAVCAESDSDSKHERYITYLINWAIDHNDEAYEGCSPAGFDEWLENEDTDYEDVPDLVLDEGDYKCEEHLGKIWIDKQVFDDFVKHSYIKIKFVNDNEDDNVYTYVMDSEDDEFITCEFIG